ncbi:MAG: CSLREA domain-containing protein [Proteobacteria bacterium]|nr:CSLREA domain-containing protein [Pseudomonadota bacterium]
MTKKWFFLFSVCMILWYVPAGAVTIGVTTLADEQIPNGQCSLREALINANHDNQSGSLDCAAGSGADIINFNENLTGTVTLVSALPAISQDLTIKGRTDLEIAISGNSSVRVFDINSGLKVTFRDLVVTRGNAYHGGGIVSHANILNIEHCRFTQNWGRESSFGGGIISSLGTVNVTESEFSENGADMGGGIYSGGTLNINNSKFQGNRARVGSGLVISGKTDIIDSEF